MCPDKTTDNEELPDATSTTNTEIMSPDATKTSPPVEPDATKNDQTKLPEVTGKQTMLPEATTEPLPQVSNEILGTSNINHKHTDGTNRFS